MPSLRGRVLNHVLKRIVRRRLETVPLTQSAIVSARQRMERLGTRVAPPHDLTRAHESLGGVATEWTRAAGGDRPIVYYCHGGGYLVGSPVPYRRLAGELCKSARCDVAMIDYRLAPEHPYPAAPDDALAGYRALLASGVNPSRIVVMGDSAGGNLAAVTLLRLRKLGYPLPAAAVLLSPWTDLSGSGDSVRRNAHTDAMLPASRLLEAARLYARSHSLTDPDISPLFGDWTDLPPLSVHVGSGEILLDDASRLVERARTAGVDAELRVWNAMPHVFPVFASVLPEGRAAIREIAAFVQARLRAGVS